MNDNPDFLPLFGEIVDKQVIDREQGTISAELRCPADFPAFDGHFPGQPVLPAVMQLVVVRMLAEELLQVPLDTVKTGKMKFKGMILPDEVVQIRVAVEKIDGLWNGVFKLSKSESVVATGSILFRPRQG
ncbi:MAG: hypothetical protein ABFS18_03555 [Thermodesulfobacteriota bacterium]